MNVIKCNRPDVDLSTFSDNISEPEEPEIEEPVSLADKNAHLSLINLH